jgi:uncharacterized integral membrane protein
LRLISLPSGVRSGSDTLPRRRAVSCFPSYDGTKGNVMRRIVGLSVACLGFIVLIMLLVWVMDGFGLANLGFHGWVAIVLGMVLTSVLGGVLMALVFQRQERARRKRRRRQAQTEPLGRARSRRKRRVAPAV